MFVAAANRKGLFTILALSGLPPRTTFIRRFAGSALLLYLYKRTGAQIYADELNLA